MKVLCFDLATNYGYFDSYTEEGGSTKLNRESLFSDFHRNSFKLIRKYNCETIVFENAARQMGHAAYIFNGMKAILELHAYEQGLKLASIHVTTVKKLFTGDGRASKQDIIDKCKSLGYDPVDDNHADAIALYYAYKEKL